MENVLNLTDEDIEYLQNQNVFIATPSQGGSIHYTYLFGILSTAELFRNYKIPYYNMVSANESLLTKVRNGIVADFMSRSEFTHLMFIDNDVGFNGADIIKLLLTKKEIVSGAYPSKTIEWGQVERAVKAGVKEEDLKYFCNTFPINFMFDKDYKLLKEKDGTIEISSNGAGFVLIQRSVFDQMMDEYPELKCAPKMSGVDHSKNPGSSKTMFDYLYTLFDTSIHPESRDFLSEDITFYYRWQQLGGKLWLQPDIQLTHTGNQTQETIVGNLYPSKDVE